MAIFPIIVHIYSLARALDAWAIAVVMGVNVLKQLDYELEISMLYSWLGLRPHQDLIVLV